MGDKERKRWEKEREKEVGERVRGRQAEERRERERIPAKAIITNLLPDFYFNT